MTAEIKKPGFFEKPGFSAVGEGKLTVDGDGFGGGFINILVGRELTAEPALQLIINNYHPRRVRHLTHRIVLLKKPGFDRRNQETRFLSNRRVCHLTHRIVLLKTRFINR
ncbi:hypothetical protein AAEJ74_18255 [Limnospira fusiformis PMC 851.14]|uniref:Uncharacterized protein n=1 Tax=Limnospira fusiformis PMC 851.14 TaxID=2219512 RepID=A0ABU9ENP7_LIMFS